MGDLRSGAAVQHMIPGVGNIDITRMEAGKLDAAVDELLDTTTLIVDLRGYPKGNATQIGRRLADSGNDLLNAQIRIPVVAGDQPPRSIEFQQRFDADTRSPYRGRLLVLINEDALSQSEQICMMLAARPQGTTFIGTPTAGANGNITQVPLPGGYHMSFTGMSVRHADGQPLQRVGIQPTVRVTPTIQGIRAGRDEILDAAIKVAKTH